MHPRMWRQASWLPVKAASSRESEKGTGGTMPPSLAGWKPASTLTDARPVLF